LFNLPLNVKQVLVNIGSNT